MSNTAITIDGINVSVRDGSVDWRVLEVYSELGAGSEKAISKLPWLARRVIDNWEDVLDQLEARDGRADIGICTKIILQAINTAAGAGTEAEAKN